MLKTIRICSCIFYHYSARSSGISRTGKESEHK